MSLDGGAVGADDPDAALHQRLGQVDGGLPAEGGDHALGLLEVHDGHDVLGGQRLEVELVGGGVVGGDGLGVVVDDDGLVARALDGLHRVDRGVVELHALADADRPGAEDEDLFLLRQAGVVAPRVGGVEIGDVLAGVQGVHHAEDRREAELAALLVDLDLPEVPEPGDELVGEAHLLGLAQHGDVVDLLLEPALHRRDLLKRLEKELGDHGDLVELFDARAAAQQLHDRVDVVVPEDGDILIERLVREGIELRVPEVADPGLERADGLEEALLKIGADAHDLARGLHLRAEGVGRVGELVEGEARELRHDVVEARLDGGGAARDRDLLQRHAERDLRGDAGDRIAAGLGGEGRGAGHAGVDLNEEILAAGGIERELHVAAALDLQLADDLDGAVVEHLEIVLAEREDGRDHDGVAGVHADGVHVLHAADRDRGVVGVAHDLKLDLLIALDALLDQHLVDGGELEGVGADLEKLRLVIGKAAAGAAEGEGGAQHDGVADARGGGLRLVEIVGDLGGDDRLPDGLAHLLEELAVLGALDAAAAGAEQLRAALAQYALALELYGEVQTRLAADAGDDGVRPLVAEDLRDVFEGQRLHVDLVRNGGVGHDGGGVGVDQDHLVALLLESEAGLRARVVEFRRLADHDRAGADDENLLDVSAFRHDVPPCRCMLYPTAKIADGFGYVPRREFKSFLRQLCRLKNSLRRVMRALVPIKTGDCPLR